VRYYGVGMTTVGREKEAAIGQMLASTARLEERETAVGPVELLRRTWPIGAWRQRPRAAARGASATALFCANPSGVDIHPENRMLRLGLWTIMNTNGWSA